MAGGNKSNSPKFKKRKTQLQEAERARRQAAKKRYGSNDR